MPEFSPRLLRGFVQTVSAELGADGLPAVLDKAGLPSHLADPAAVARLDASAAAQAYADIQRALRLYFGRGARGILLRVGTQFWKRVLDDTPLSLKPQITMTRTLATASHPKPALDLLAKLLSAKTGDITVHTLDLDLLLVDHASPATHEQHDNEPICWVTVSLMRACIHWATGRDLDVAERACRAMGASACEFHIKTGA
jgi:predicted hydrocarbon binding protein